MQPGSRRFVAPAVRGARHAGMGDWRAMKFSGSASESKSGSRQGKSLNKNLSAAWSSVLRLRILDVTAAMARSEGIAEADGLSGISAAAVNVVRAGWVSGDVGFIGSAGSCELMTVRCTGGGTGRGIEPAANSTDGMPSALEDGGGTIGAGESAAGAEGESAEEGRGAGTAGCGTADRFRSGGLEGIKEVKSSGKCWTRRCGRGCVWEPGMPNRRFMRISLGRQSAPQRPNYADSVHAFGRPLSLQDDNYSINVPEGNGKWTSPKGQKRDS
jgi:hypothetical protein